ncbi:MAG: chemotaxis protein CheB [Verrucomicrobiota bacterium]
MKKASPRRLKSRPVAGVRQKPASQPASPPANGISGFPIVGIGASAGGLKAFGEFFSGMPADSGMAFVLVQHLAPDHESILCELVRRFTPMQVFEVEDGMPVQINCVYIIPPNRDMALLNGALQLIEPLSPHGHRLPIDFFFRTLAQDQHERAIGIVLSGTASDGTLGLSAIKGEGGMVMAQSPESAEFDGMPRNAIATGLMDFELSPCEMPAKLLAYATHAFHNRIRLTAAPTAGSRDDDALKKIFVLLRSFTSHDFSQYKPSTIRRRVERRMAMQEIETIDNYVKFLQQSPAEGTALFRDLLIGVTNFFRDPEAFKFLEEQGIPKLFEGKPPGSTIRVWSAGCSTGEEAYSLAILLQERMEALGQSHTLQIFATDIDSRAVATARAARYPTSIAADITPARLKRFFTPEPGGDAYRVHKSIRNLLIFSEHDLIKDPPFSKIDLVSCRNLLIYLNADLQNRIIPIFHYTMNPDGLLFLGTSETVGGFDDLFAPLDRRAKLYRRKENRYGARPPVMDQLSATQPLLNAEHPQFAGKAAPASKLSPRELAEKAMVQHIQASALVNERGDLLYIHGRTGRYLELTPDDVGINNILKIAREGLRHELSVALHRAARGKEVVVSPGVRVKTNGDFTTINLTVSPVLANPGAMPEVPLYVVILEEAPDPPDPPDRSDQPDKSDRSDARVMELNKKLQVKEEYLQTSLEELESSTEELKSSNEEMQSVNEELQSSNEELETAKEELQSTNEELHTVNTELQIKVVDLAQASNDINNLLVGTGIGTMFVDLHLRILRFTSPVTEIISVTSNDAGRPVHDFSTRFKKYSTLEEDVRAVLNSLVPVEREVQTTQDKWYLLRILPYRTTENVIEGATISFVDITEHKRGELVAARLAAIVESSDDAIISKDLNGIIISWNRGAEKLFGYPAAEIVGTSILRLVPDDRRQEEQDILEKIKGGESVDHFETLRQAKDGRLLDVSLTASPIRDADGAVVGASKVARDITERKKAEEALRKANDVLRLAVVVRDAHDAVTVQDLEGHTIAWNPGAVRMYGWSEDEALAMNVRDRIPQGLREGALNTLAQLSRSQILEPYRTQRISKDGAVLQVSIISTALLDEAGKMYAIATTERAAREDNIQ